MKKIKLPDYDKISQLFDPERNRRLYDALDQKKIKVFSIPTGVGKTTSILNTTVPYMRSRGCNFLNFNAPTTEIAYDFDKIKNSLGMAGLSEYNINKGTGSYYILKDDEKTVKKIQEIRGDIGRSVLMILLSTPSLFHARTELVGYMRKYHRQQMIIVDEAHSHTSSSREEAARNNGVLNDNYPASFWNGVIDPVLEFSKNIHMLSATVSPEQREERDGKYVMVVDYKDLPKDHYQQMVAHSKGITLGYNPNDVDKMVEQTSIEIKSLMERNVEVNRVLNNYRENNPMEYGVDDILGVGDIPPTVYFGVTQQDGGSFTFETFKKNVANGNIYFPENHFYVQTSTTVNENDEEGGAGTAVFNHKGQRVTPWINGKKPAPTLTSLSKHNGPIRMKLYEQGEKFLPYMTYLNCWKDLINTFADIIGLLVIDKGKMGVDCPRIKTTLVYGATKVKNDMGYITKTPVQVLGRGFRQNWGGAQNWEQFSKLPPELQEAIYHNCYCWNADCLMGIGNI